MNNKENAKQMQKLYLDLQPSTGLTYTHKVLDAINKWEEENRDMPRAIAVSPAMLFELKGEWMRNMDKGYTAKRHHSRNEWYIVGHRLITSDMVEVDEILIF